MKLKIYTAQKVSFNGPLTCLDWSNSEEVYSASEDNNILRWYSESREYADIAKLPDNFIPSDMHWSLGRTSGPKYTDLLLVASNDGRFVILNKSTRVEKNIRAHAMAITACQWSPDGTGLLTASEDGFIKIWSRSGMLRSTVVQDQEPIRCATWSPTSTAIAFAQGGYITIKLLEANSKITKWRAHDEAVVCISWSLTSDLIASGGLDYRYKIWNTQGRNIFTSQVNAYAITSIAFSPGRDLLAVGGYNVIKLCSHHGWTYSTSNLQALGSTFGLVWSPNGTQVACGTSTGNMLFAHLIETQLVSRNLKATTTGKTSILVQDIASGTRDILDFTDRIVNFAVGYGHMVVATTHQLQIFNENYINTPVIIDGRPDIRFIDLGKKYFIAMDFTAILIYTYTGRVHSTPRFPGLQAQIYGLTSKMLSIGLNMFLIQDCSDKSKIYIFGLLPSVAQEAEPLTFVNKNQININELATCRSGNSQDQYFAFIDINKNLFIGAVNDKSVTSVHKIGTQLQTIKWASETNILIGIHETYYTIWYCPGEAAFDPSLLMLTSVTVDLTEYGQNIVVQSFEGSLFSFWCSGIFYTLSINIYCEVIHRLLMDQKWQKAVQICRLANNTVLWGTLAAIATKKNQYNISEEAFSAILQVDKVNYLQYVKRLQASASSPEYMAENSLMLGRLIEGETILLHNKKYEEAISLCVRMHNWQRAIDIADKNCIEKKETILKQLEKYRNALHKKQPNKEQNKHLLSN